MKNFNCMDQFVKAAREVLKLMLDLDVTEIRDVTEDSAEKEVAVSIGLTGNISGSVIFLFPRSTTLEMMKIMAGMEIDEIDGFTTSALGEMANIISGNAATYLSNESAVCDILPPKVELLPNDAGLKLMKDQLCTLHTLHTPAGDLKVGFVAPDAV